MTELHGLSRGKGDCVSIYIVVGVVGDSPGPAVPLGNNPQWAEAEVFEVLD